MYHILESHFEPPFEFSGDAGRVTTASSPQAEPLLIDRYIAREVVKPLVAMSAILVVIFAGYSSGRYLSDAVAGLLPADTLGTLILLKAVIALEVLLPVAFYLSVVLGLGRLHSNSEITAMRACGVSELRIILVVFTLSLGLALAVASLSLHARPWAYEQSYWIKARADADIDIDEIESGNFYESRAGNRTIFVERSERQGKRLKGVFMRTELTGAQRITYAEEGYEKLDLENGKRYLVLIDARVYQVTPQGTQDKIGRFGQLTLQLRDPEPASVGYKRKAATTAALAGSTEPADVAEYQWRMSTPVSTVLLGFLGIVVSRTGPKRTRYAKALTAVVIYAVYYNLTAMAKTWIEAGFVGTVPGIWWPQALLAALLAVLLMQPNWAFRRPPRGPAPLPAGTRS
jgi:lipopolysaccharide export system permease protein